MKTIDKIRKISLGAALAGTIAILAANAMAAPDDHTVIVRNAQTVKEIVNAELQSARFAEQIASYNGIPNISTILPVGAKLAIPRPYMKSLDFGRIAFVKGDVLHSQTDLVVNPPARGALVRNGDVFQTGLDGFVSLSFNSGARVNLQPESRVLINNIDCAKAAIKCVISVSATKGQVHSEITPRPEGQPPVKFSVDTPFLTAAVRGTAFYVDVSKAENRIGVTKGLVATDSAGAQNELPRGKGLSAKPGVAAKVVDLLEPPVLSVQSDILLVSAEDSISWGAIEGAISYQASIANDQSMSEPVFVTQTEKQSVSAELAAGDYYLNVSGVDENSFIGLPASVKINYAEITETEQPRLVIARRGAQVELSMPDHEGEMQLLIGNSIDSEEFASRTLANAAELLTLDLDESRDWVFRARKITGAHQVSAYSDYYVLGAE